MSEYGFKRTVYVVARALWIEHWDVHYGRLMAQADDAERAEAGRKLAAHDWDNQRMVMHMKLAYLEMAAPVVDAVYPLVQSAIFAELEKQAGMLD